MSDELKPVSCGCGGEAKVDKHTYYRALPTYGVRCHRCGQETRQFYMNEAEAIQAWNTAMGTNTRRLLEVLVHDATDNYVGDKFDKDTNVGDKERTAKVEGNRCSVCDNYIRPCMKYCDHCGARLEWE